MGTLKIDGKLARGLALKGWVENVETWANRSLKEKETPYFSIDVKCPEIKDLEDYNWVEAKLEEDLPAIEKWAKKVDKYGVELTYTIDTKRGTKKLIFQLPCYDLALLSEIAGCKLIETKHVYTSVSCEAKAHV